MEENLLPFPEMEPIIYRFFFPWISPEVEGLKEPALPLRAKPETFPVFSGFALSDVAGKVTTDLK